LLITGTPRGSFGFELEAIETPDSLLEAVESATQAIAAASESDDALADASAELDLRSFTALQDFLSLLRKARASVRLVTADRETALEVSDVERAAERTEANRTEEDDVDVFGEYLAILPDARRFEFRKVDGEIVRGRVTDHLTMTELREMNAKWTNKMCKARVHVIRLLRAGQVRERFTLEDVQAAEGSEK
jgi:hypothetical protein